MNEINRTPPAPDLKFPLTPPEGQALAALNADGIDTRAYRSLSPADQIAWLEVNSRRLHEYYVAMTTALAKLKAEQRAEVPK